MSQSETNDNTNNVNELSDTPVVKVTNKILQEKVGDNYVDVEKNGKKQYSPAVLITTTDMEVVFPMLIPLAKIDEIAKEKAENGVPFEEVPADRRSECLGYALKSTAPFPPKIDEVTSEEIEPERMAGNYYPVYPRKMMQPTNVSILD